MRSANVELVHRWFDEIWQKGRLSAIDEMLAPDGIIYGLAETGYEAQGHEDFRNFVSRFRSAFTDIRVTIEQTVEEGDMVASRWKAEMVHTGDGLGIPPTGKPVTVTGMSMGRFRNGRMIEGWNIWDQMALMTQIESVPRAARLKPD